MAKSEGGDKTLLMAIGLSVVSLYLAMLSFGNASLTQMVYDIAETSIIVSLLIEFLNYVVDGGSLLWEQKKGIYLSAIVAIIVMSLLGVFPYLGGHSLIVGINPLVGALAMLYIVFPFELSIEHTTIQKAVLISGWFVLWLICLGVTYILGNGVTPRITPFGW